MFQTSYTAPPDQGATAYRALCPIRCRGLSFASAEAYGRVFIRAGSIAPLTNLSSG